MRLLCLILFLSMLAGCNVMGGVQPDLAAAVQNAGAGCIRIDSLVMGSGRITFANDTLGAIGNGSIAINPDTCGITITNANGSAVTPVQTTTTGTSTVTTVTVPR
jgi:hypothetical protein